MFEFVTDWVLGPYTAENNNSVGLSGESAFAMVFDGRRVVGRLAFLLVWLGEKGRAICLRGRMKCFRRAGLAIRVMVLTADELLGDCLSRWTGWAIRANEVLSQY